MTKIISEIEQINEQFVNACKKANLNHIKTFLNAGADIHYDNDIALRTIDYHTSFDIFSFLIEQGANVNCCDSCLVSVAAYRGHLDILKYLKEKGANLHVEKDNPFVTACSRGHLDVVLFFIENGAKIQIKKNAALRLSAESGHLDVVKLLHSHGANIHSEKDYAFRKSAADGHLDVAQYLLENGADINANNGYALEYSIQNEHMDVIKYLLVNHAKIYSVDNSILKNAIRRNIEILDLLIQYGADINFEDSYALQFAAQWNDIHKMHYFLSKGADLYVKDHLILKNYVQKLNSHFIEKDDVNFLYFLCDLYQDKLIIQDIIVKNLKECDEKIALVKHIEKLVLTQKLNNELIIQSTIQNKLKL